MRAPQGAAGGSAGAGDGAAGPAVAADVAAALDRLAPDGPLGVAVSGGSDSVALLIAAQDWARARGRALRVATVDHGLRAAAAGEARDVARLAAGLGLSHDTLAAQPFEPGNLAARARAARLGLLAAWARQAGLAAVLLGHTLDDQAETVLMRLGRGSGADGLSGMAEAGRQRGVLWLRPLLGLRRAALRAFLAARGIGWIDDPTNADRASLRVRVRAAMAALEAAGIAPGMIAASAARLAAQRRVLAQVTADLAARARRIGPAGEILIDRAALAGADPEIAGRLLADSIRAISGADYAPRGAPLAALAAGLCATPPRGASLGGVLVRPARGGQVLLCREPAAMAPPVPVGPDGAVWDGRWQVGPDDAGAGLSLGALGPQDVRTLSPALRPAGWEVMAHTVRIGLPAIRRQGAVVAIALPGGGGAQDAAGGRDLVRLRLLWGDQWRYEENLGP
ncbi:MAG: tRNA lysidine(34) synthetase TilS [Thermohalobaculum sp.]|nr:tRNA lysidine(34) synthetase TilS [Thermohalobaculum sp.]